MEKLDIYRCSVCGNIVQSLVPSFGELVCCGKPMEKLVAKKFEENITEKHVPVFVKSEDNLTEIRIGEVLHPMIPEHYIMFIQAFSNDKNNVQLKFLNPGEDAKMHLNENYSNAIEYCNIHGLWEGNND